MNNHDITFAFTAWKVDSLKRCVSSNCFQNPEEGEGLASFNLLLPGSFIASLCELQRAKKNGLAFAVDCDTHSASLGDFALGQSSTLHLARNRQGTKDLHKVRVNFSVSLL